MKLHLPKQLFTALLAALTLAAPAALTLGSTAWGAEETIIKYDADGNVIPADDTSTEVVRTETVYTATSTINGVGTSAPQIGDSGNSFNLINYVDAGTDASKLVIEGNGQGTITTTVANGGWGGRVTFAALASDATTYCQDVTLTKGIEADITNIQGNGNIVLTVDNASIYGNTNNYAVTLNIGDNGVRFNGGAASSYTWSSVVTGIGDVVVLVGSENTTLTLTGDTSSYSGTWKTSTSRVFAFGNGGACANGQVGGNVSNNSGAWYNYAGSYEVLGSIDTGTIKVNGGEATFSGSISATTAMEIATGASATISGNATTVGLTNNGELTVADTGTLTISGASALGSTIVNNGTLNLNGNLTASQAGVFSLAATGTGLNTAGNGFYENVTYVLATGSGTVNVGEGVTLTLGSGDAVTTPALMGGGTNTVYFDEAADSGTYYVFADTSASAVEAAVNTRKESEAEFALSSIYVNSGSTLSYDSGSFSSVSLKGNGVYDAGATKTMTSGLTVDSSWRGTVKIHDSTNGADIQLNTLGVAGSMVDISNVSGYFQSGSSSSSHAIAPDINLSGNLTITDGYNGSFYEFHGKLSGTGNLNLQRSGGPTNTFYFMNDISGWSGTLNHTAQSDNIYLQGGANEINAAFNRTGGTLNLYVETNAAATFSKAVTVSNLTLNQSATFTNALTVANAATIAAGKTLTLDGNVTSSITGNLTNNGALVVQNGGTLSINSAITNAGSLTIADGAKLQINSLSGYNSTADYTLSGADGTYGYQEGLTLTYNLVTGAGSFTLNGSVMLGETDITSSVTNGQYIVTPTEKVYEITGAYTGPVIEYNGSSGDTAQADSFIVHEGASLKITDTANSNGALGKNVSGEGTLIIAAAANDTISFTGSSMADFTGTVDVISGAVYLGNVAGQNSGAAADFAASKIIVRNGAAFWTHMSAETLGANIDLLSGATLGNKDKNNDYQGNIRFNIVDPDAETASYNKDGVVTINQYWQKNVKFSGRLEGDGVVQMKAANVEANANYELSNVSNTFAGTYKVIDGDNANNSGKTTTLKLSSATAAQYATIDLASTGAVSVLKLAGNSTIAALYGSDADNYVTTDATGTLTVSEGSFGGKMQNGSNATLSLTKTGSGTLTLSGTLGASGAALGSITVNGGNLEILNTSYVTSVNMTGGNLTYGGTDVTHTISEGVTSSNGSRNSTFAVASGSTVNLASFNNAWGVYLDIDGTITISGSLKQAFNHSGLCINGDGSVTAGSLDVSNQSKFDVAVTTLNVTGGFNMSGNSSKVTFTSGSTTTISGATNIATNNTAADSINKVIFEGGVAELNGAVTNGAIIEVNAGSATLNGAVTNTGSINVNGGSTTLNGGISGAGTVALTGGSLILGSGEGVTNEIAQFNYSGGTLSHSGLTVTNATFSGCTLVNTGALTLNGTLNVTNIGGLTKGEGSYSGGAVEGNGYYTGSLTVITGNNKLSYGDSFALQLNGSALTDDSTNTSFYTKSENGTLTLNVTDTSTFIVNTGTESLAYGTVAAYHVAAGATLEFSGTQAASAALTKSVTGTGTVKVTFDTSNHNESVQFGDVFNGELEVSGYMHLANFRLGKDATIKLANGQVWNQNATTSAYKILLAGENEESFSFIGSELTLTGEVTGTYLTTSANMNLLNAANSITQVKVKGDTIKLNAGTYDTVKVAGGTVNVTGGSVTTVDYIGSGTVNFKLAQGQSATSYTLNEIKNTDTDNYERNLTVDSGVTLTTEDLTNSWGMGTMTINGTLIVNGEMMFSTGNNNSTSNNVLTGSGIVCTEKLIIGNSGKYNLSGLTLKIGSGGIIKDTAIFWDGNVMLNLGALTIEATEDWSSDLNKIQLVGATGAPTVFNTAGHTITMSAGGISGTGELKKAGEGTLVLSGANSYTGATTVEGGTLQITEAAAVNSSAGVSMESGARLKYTGSGTETLSTPLSGAGSFTMAGSGTLTLSGANTYTGGTTVQEGELIISSAGSLGTGSVQLEAGSILTLEAGVTNAIQVNGAGAEIKLSNNAGLDHSTSVTTNNDAKVAYTVNSGSTLTISKDGNTSNIESLNIAGGKVKLSAWNASLGSSEDAVDMTLSNDGMFSFTNGNSDSNGGKMYLNVEVDGSGKLAGSSSGDHSNIIGTISSNGDSAHDTLKLGKEGSTSNWWTISATIKDHANGTDKLAVQKVDDVRVVLSGANTYSGGTTIEAGTVTTTNASALGTGGVAVSGTGVLSVAENLKLQDTLQLSGASKVQVATGKSLNLQDKVNLSSTDGTNAATMTAKADGTALAQLQEDASFTIEDMTLTNTTIPAATPTTQVNFSNVTVEGATVLRNMQASMTDANVAAGGSEGVKGVFTASTSLLSGITLANTDAVGSTITVDLGDLSCAALMGPGKYDLSITLSDFTMQDYTQGIVFAADSWLGQLLSRADNADVQVSFSPVEAAAAAAEGGAASGVTYSTGSVGSLVITISGLNVPEPTSATLGLAALMMLCARRRRKA